MKESYLVKKEFWLLPVPLMYRMRAIKFRSWFETALDYKPRILGPKIEEFPSFSTEIVCNTNRSTI